MLALPRVVYRVYTSSTCSRIKLNEAQESLVEGFCVYLHDMWARDLLDKYWQVGEEFSEEERTHPELVPFEQLPAEVGHVCMCMYVHAHVCAHGCVCGWVGILCARRACFSMKWQLFVYI